MFSSEAKESNTNALEKHSRSSNPEDGIGEAHNDIVAFLLDNHVDTLEALYSNPVAFVDFVEGELINEYSLSGFDLNAVAIDTLPGNNYVHLY